MSKIERWIAVIGFVAGLGIVGPLIAQQEFSGGQTVTVGNASIPVTESGTWTVQPGNTPNTTAWKVDGSAVTQPVSGTVSVNALPAGSALIGQTYPYSSCGTTKFTQALQAMPTSSTAITASTTCIYLLSISNTSAGSLTVTLSDNQGTPINFLNAVTVLAGETRQYVNLGKFTSGIKVQASGSGITYALEGLQ